MLLLWLAACRTSTPIDFDSKALFDEDTALAGYVDSGLESVDGESPFGCEPAANTVSVDEGQVAILQFACTGEATAESWEVISAPGNASINAQTGELTWQTDLASAGEWTIVVRAIGAGDESGSGTVWVIDAWDHPDNQPVNPLTYTEELGLPVLHIAVPADINRTTKVPTTIVYRGESFDVEVEYRGAASSYYPKLSYELDFPPDHEFSDDAQAFDKSRSIAVITTFDDNAYFRQKMVYDLWNAMNPGRQQLHAMFAVVYLDGVYEGVYTLVDRPDGEWWEDYGFREDGNLYKSVDHAANFYAKYNGDKSSWHQGYEKKEGLPEDDFADLDALVQFVATSPDENFEAGIEQMMSLDDIYDWWALVIFVEGDDSGGKNAYLYNDPLDPKWHHAPWDFNHSLGQTWQTERESAYYDWDFTSANGLFFRLLESPNYGEPMRARFRTHRDTVLAPTMLESMIDGYIDLIDASARRDWDKWQEEYRSYSGWSWRTDWTTYDEEVQYVRTWLDQRWEFVEEWDP